MSDPLPMRDAAGRRAAPPWMTTARGVLVAWFGWLVTLAAHPLPVQAAPGAAATPDLLTDLEAVVARLAEPALPRLSRAAARRQALTPAELASLEDQAGLTLTAIVADLQRQHAALADRAAAAQAIRAAVELPQALRDAVQATRSQLPRSAP